MLSRHGSLVYELYTPGIERPEAHFMMSTSKSVTSAIVGAAIDRGLISGPDASVTDLLPANLFATPADAARFGAVTLKDVMGMSALAGDEPPRDTSPSGVARGDAFVAASNRVTFALTQALVPTPGTSFQYNDITPMLAGGAVQYATGKRLFDFGNETIFTPLAFENAEWIGEDATGLDLAAYGLRLRPLDMQKFGMLYLDGGSWNGKQILSSSWVDTTFRSWLNTGAGVTPGYDNYGYYWWHRSDWGPEIHWTSGWRGQYIVDIPQYDAVFTMTADIETGDEETVLQKLDHQLRGARAGAERHLSGARERAGDGSRHRAPGRLACESAGRPTHDPVGRSDRQGGPLRAVTETLSRRRSRETAPPPGRPRTR